MIRKNTGNSLNDVSTLNHNDITDNMTDDEKLVDWNHYIKETMKMAKSAELLYMDQPKYNLFLDRMNNQSEYDERVEKPTLLAITVNIKPGKLMNKKRWNTYEPAKQVAMLDRIEKALHRKNPSIKCLELHYEVCPNLLPKQMHFHALYEIRGYEWIMEIKAYYDRICNANDEKTIKPWHHLDIQEIYNLEGWEGYIRKDMDKPKY